MKCTYCDRQATRAIVRQPGEAPMAAVCELHAIIHGASLFTDTLEDSKWQHNFRLAVQFLVDADVVARQRGDVHGLCDSLSNTGEAYRSSSLEAFLNLVHGEGFKGTITLEEAMSYVRDPSSPWYEKLAQPAEATVDHA